MQASGEALLVDKDGKEIDKMPVPQKAVLFAMERRYPVRRIFFECRKEIDPREKDDDEELFLKVAVRIVTDTQRVEAATIRVTDLGLQLEVLTVMDHVGKLICKELDVDISCGYVVSSKESDYPKDPEAFKKRFFHVGIFDEPMSATNMERRSLFPKYSCSSEPSDGSEKKKKKKRKQPPAADKKDDVPAAPPPKKVKGATMWPVFSDLLGMIIELTDTNDWLSGVTVGTVLNEAVEWCETNVPIIIP